MAQLPTGTVTFLFTDIEGSTRLLQRLGEDYARALGDHQTLLRAAFAAHDGAEVDTQGDAFFVAFATAPAAVAAAAEATRALATHAWPEGAPLRVRIGLHTGAPQLVGDHYVGLDVHRAARIAAAGHGGQILLSQTTRDLVEHSLPADCALSDLGAHRLKDLQQPERITQLVLTDGMVPGDFPPLKTLDTHQHNLPVQPTPLLDRVEQVAALTALLRREDVWLVTLTGPGGIGKTRLAIQVAAELVENFRDGVWLVRLSRLVDPGLVIPTIAQTLGLKERRSQPITETLREYLADKRLLLVLDNFEQVVGAAGEVASLLGSSPGLSVLVTSRTRLRLRGEREYPLTPLPLPDSRQAAPLNRLTQYAAVALFIERAQAAQPTFAVSAANAPAIAEICARLDGLPLAIELAAVRVKLLPPPAMLARLSRQLTLLTGGARDLEERQQTMRATLAWSAALLTSAEQTLFQRLAVFVGGCTLEAAEAVCAAPDGAAPLEVDLLEGLNTLVDHSLVQQREEDDEPRFGMLQVIREYALERLESSGEADALRRAHAAYFLTLAELADQGMVGPQEGAWLERLEAEHDNLRAALGWAREQREVETGLRLVAALRGFWWGHGHLREGREWVEGLLAQTAGEGFEIEDGALHTEGGVADATSLALAQVRARALLTGGTMSVWQGDAAVAGRWLAAAAALAKSVGDPHTAAEALNERGILAAHQGAWEQAVAYYEESLALWRPLGNEWGIGLALNNLGDVAIHLGDLERATTALAEALERSRAVADQGMVAFCLLNLGWVARLRGAVAQAEGLQREALALAWELGDPLRCAAALEQLASTAGAAGQGARAARLLGAAAAARETIGAPQPAPEQADVKDAVAAARAALGEATWSAAFASGKALALEMAVAEALGEAN